jgi:hypothetical protein
MGEWLLANINVVAAFLSVIATALAAFATYRAPIMAANVSEQLKQDGERKNYERRLREYVFFTLMQERVTMASAQSVQVLNSIDVVFHDCPGVREAWADLYHAYGRLSETPTSTVEEKHRELLRQMAIVLGLSQSLKRDDFSRVYYPTALAEENYVRNLQRAMDKKRLEESASQTANTAPIFSGTNPYPPKP